MAITAEQVKKLRERTGAGMMACKDALSEKDGDLEAAIQYLREQGIVQAKKRGSRAASEGLIQSYIHLGGKIGVLVEVNSETDFAARSDPFQQFVKDLVLQICSANPQWLSREDVPKEIIGGEMEIFHSQAKKDGKPEKIWDRIAEGRLKKFYQENCLMEQPFVKNDEITIEQYRNDVISKTGENIVVRRFVRFQVGEELDE